MQRNPPVIRNAFLGNTGNYSFGAAVAAAVVAAAAITILFLRYLTGVVSLYLEDDRTNRSSSRVPFLCLDADRVSIRSASPKCRALAALNISDDDDDDDDETRLF